MNWLVRRLGPDDAAALQRLQQEAFGVPTRELPLPDVERAGRSWWGSFAEGVLVGTAMDHAYDGWFGGRVLPVAGIGGVTVAAEARGSGVLRPLMLALLEGARQRGAVVSTLFPSAPGIYRSLGYESFVGLRWVEVPSHVLAAVPPPSGVVLRRASADDAEQIRLVYDTWAAGVDGPLTRRGVSFPATDAELVAGFTGITLARDAGSGELVGYASWRRGAGDDGAHAVEVEDLVATRADAYAALLRTVGSFASMTATVRLRTTGDDVLRHLLPSRAWRVVADDPYMLTVLDVAAAFTGTRCAPGLSARLAFRVAGGAIGGVDGGYVVEASAGSVSCARADADDRVLAPRGLALLVTGATPCRELRSLGLLSGGDPTQDADWDALVSGRSQGVLDDF